MTPLRALFLLLCLLPAIVSARAPKAGTYRGTFNLYIRVETTITLVPAANGVFTVTGTMWPEEVGKRRKDNTFIISGTLNKKGQLRAKARKPGSGNEGQILDGHWDDATGSILITKYGSMDFNMLMKSLKQGKPEKQDKPAVEGGFMAGAWNGGSQWGPVTIKGGPTKYEGTYKMGHEGKFTLAPGQTGELVGKWYGLDAHEGTMMVTSMIHSKAWKAKVATVSWKCNKKCDDFCPKQGSGVWTEKKP